MEPKSIKLLAPGGLDSRIPEAPLCCALRAKRGLAFSFCPKPFGFEVFGHEALTCLFFWCPRLPPRSRFKCARTHVARSRRAPRPAALRPRTPAAAEARSVHS